MEVDISDEEYVIQRAKSALKTDPLSAKAWMITAKTLYPNNFGVQVIYRLGFILFFIDKF
jgi:integrator complex subunit 10